MGGPLLKSLRSPDDVYRSDLIEERSVQVGEQTIGRARLEPGWRWSVHVKPAVGTRSCMVRHIGLVLAGRFHVEMDDGTTLDAGPDDVFDIPPGHDAWVVGDEPWESVEIAGIYGFGRPAHGGAYVTTILISDIVDSTATAQRVGSVEWARILELHLESCRRVLDRYQGLPVKTTGDGILATFDGAARALRAAAELHQAARAQGLELRVGIHTGEVESVPGDIRGLSVHFASRIAALAEPGVTLVSATTRDVVSAADVSFEDAGTHQLKGLQGTRQLFAARLRVTR